ncbi:MAG: hypothetical protein WC394_03085, partial [Candidatus Omnitrophota bacterium]
DAPYKFNVFGSDLKSTFNAQRVSGRMDSEIKLTSHKIGSGTGLWQVSTLSPDLTKITNTITDGFVWTKQVNQINGLSLAGQQGFVDNKSFDLKTFDAFKNNKNVIPFQTGFGVNLNGAAIENGQITGPGLAFNYQDRSGNILPQRIIRGDLIGDVHFEETVFDNGKGLLATDIKNAAVFAENYFVGNSPFSAKNISGTFTQNVTGLTSAEMSTFASKMLGGKSIIAPESIKMNLNQWDAKLFDNGSINLFSPKNQVLYSSSPFLNIAGNGTSESAISGAGVELNWITPIALNSRVNIHEGVAGMQLTPTGIDNKTGMMNYSADFAPTYSPGAKWNNVGFFAQETKIDPYTKQEVILPIGGVRLTKDFSVGTKIGSPTLGSMQIMGPPTPGNEHAFAAVTNGQMAGLLAGRNQFITESKLFDSTLPNEQYKFDYTYNKAFNMLTASDIAKKGTEQWNTIVGNSWYGAHFEGKAITPGGTEFNIWGGKIDIVDGNKLPTMWLHSDKAFRANQETLISKVPTGDPSVKIIANGSIGVVKDYERNPIQNPAWVDFSSARFSLQEPVQLENGKWALAKPFFNDLAIANGALWTGNIPDAAKSAFEASTGIRNGFVMNSSMPDLIATKFVNDSGKELYTQRNFWAATTPGKIDYQSGIRIEDRSFPKMQAIDQGWMAKNAVSVFQGEKLVNASFTGPMANWWNMQKGENLAPRLGQVLATQKIQGKDTLLPIAVFGKATLQTPRVSPGTGDSSPLRLNDAFETKVLDVTGGLTPNFTLSKILVQENFDQKTGKYGGSFVLEAGKLTYSNVRAGINEKGMLEAGIKFADGTFALPLRQIEIKDANGKSHLETIWYGAGTNQKDSTITFDYNAAADQLALNKDAGRLIQQTALGKDNYFTHTTETGLITQAKNLWRYDEMLNPALGDKGWKAPDARVNFGDLGETGKGFMIQQSAPGIALQNSKIVAQDTRLFTKDGQTVNKGEPIFHYLAKDLLFDEPGRAIGGENGGYALGYSLEHNSIFPNINHFITAKDAEMPVIMGLGEKGDFNVNVVSMADGLSYKYNSFNDVKMGLVTLQTGNDKIISVKDSNILLPDGAFKGDETRGNLNISGDYLVTGGKITQLENAAYKDKSTGELLTIGQSSFGEKFGLDQHGRTWDMETGLIDNTKLAMTEPPKIDLTLGKMPEPMAALAEQSEAEKKAFENNRRIADDLRNRGLLPADYDIMKDNGFKKLEQVFNDDILQRGRDLAGKVEGLDPAAIRNVEDAKVLLSRNDILIVNDPNSGRERMMTRAAFDKLQQEQNQQVANESQAVLDNNREVAKDLMGRGLLPANYDLAQDKGFVQLQQASDKDLIQKAQDLAFKKPEGLAVPGEIETVEQARSFLTAANSAGLLSVDISNPDGTKETRWMTQASYNDFKNKQDTEVLQAAKDLAAQNPQGIAVPASIDNADQARDFLKKANAAGLLSVAITTPEGKKENRLMTQAAYDDYAQKQRQAQVEAFTKAMPIVKANIKGGYRQVWCENGAVYEVGADGKRGEAIQGYSFDAKGIYETRRENNPAPIGGPSIYTKSLVHEFRGGVGPKMTVTRADGVKALVPAEEVSTTPPTGYGWGTGWMTGTVEGKSPDGKKVYVNTGYFSGARLEDTNVPVLGIGVKPRNVDLVSETSTSVTVIAPVNEVRPSTHMHKNEDFTVTVLPRENYSETNTVLVSGEEVYVDSDSGAVLDKRG